MPTDKSPLSERDTVLCDRLRERLAARRELSAKLATALTESALQ